ncbi:MAG: cytochrome C [Candidatus Woesearchaeota archaeon]
MRVKTQTILLLLILNKFLLSQISPGELSNVHSKFDGLQNCTKCHTIGEGLSNQKCLDCHNEIKEKIKNNSGYHASSEVKTKNCWKCHSEHNGKNFRIVNLDKKNFNHDKTGFSLTGKHKSIECNDCHKEKFTKNRKINSSYIGLDKRCTSCHEDIHQKSAGENCLNCHNTSSFNENIKFDHNITNFQLLGAHKLLSCSDCHKKVKSGDSYYVKFQNKDNIFCTDCHIDVHKNKFERNCLVCHNYESFNNVKRNYFDHSKTGFILAGKHLLVKCEDCHKGSYTISLKHEKCLDCHKDYHKGEFISNNSVRDCKECHNENGFSPSNFTIENHQTTNFSLTGSHLAVQCISCHKSKNEWKFRFLSIDCISCHLNIHEQEISFEFIGKDKCENCHNADSWRNINFDHNKTKFRLSGRHSLINCSDCHVRIENSNKVYAFKSLKSSCLSCHNDIHYKQYKSEECNNCHNFDKWIPSTFDHSLANFAISGAHKNVECIKCHTVKKTDNQIKYILYKIGNKKCSDCHL